MVLGARLRTAMSSIIRWRKAEILPAGGIEYAEGLVLLIASNGTGKRRPTPSWRSSNQVSVRLAGRGKRTPGPGQRRANPTGRVSTLRLSVAPRCGGDPSQRGDASPARLYSIVDVASVLWKPPLSMFMAMVRL